MMLGPTRGVADGDSSITGGSLEWKIAARIAARVAAAVLVPLGLTMILYSALPVRIGALIAPMAAVGMSFTMPFLLANR